ncbi:MAG: hypothetical protein ACLPX9_16805 [Rhodomicrobium sp.]
MKMLFPALLLGSAIAFAVGAAAAQEPQTATQNPFGQGAQQASPASTVTKKKNTRAAPALTAGQFANEADAKANCPSDTVVWANIGTKVYHHAGAGSYGRTKHGAYMCEKDTAAAGFRAAKNEKSK